ncbi:UNVERIFIED_CONTAM: hypothetical protein PYX00_011641 [Menopon gallinae]|uniref:Uncharacterized protein n=1 Tax=Menopon gallinae TaxID=328185 RepID=A0AAW2H8C5_9NEOP
MDIEQKYRKAIKTLQVPHDHFLLLPGLPDTWDAALNEMLARVSEFEVVELDVTENTLGDVDEDSLRGAVLQRY